MKKTAILLCLVMIFGVLAMPASAAGSLREPTDVPKVFISTSESLSRDYIDCTVEIIDEKGGTHEAIRDNDSKVKIRGNSTSSGEKKPFNIKFSGKTDVLGMGKNKKWCLLANCYERTLIRNQTVFDFAESIGLDYTPSYRVVDVYHNNRFLGSYLLTDAVEASETRV
ncbi:MAG: CotH kinase family protein, partial [Clostridia bacterium]|nr:CotH kinase family protein [Clostridia bacterium]